ncbi:VOC family protein [Natrarchaeobius oligotrophus]|uniref:Ring-cleaving dioxygenase n=1 Tax=Natrarchaeobius chitinivorans TaxID=1679083 RepID=A0A3N6PPS5_NATCH|nr:VOC family protein [Natrarchaeobius chitinivorans]RQH01206.1 ring-cleaving dioxygenase [Natrarchaeobius chitinivorans]
MLTDTPGFHHVTGIVGDAQEAVDFYVGTLGLRLVARTVNFEDLLQHHLYFGDATGAPGTVFTVFPDPHADPGRVGPPQPESVSFAVPSGVLEYWRDRLAARGVDVEGPLERFDERALRFTDPAGSRLELVATSLESSTGIDPSESSRSNASATSPATANSADEPEAADSSDGPGRLAALDGPVPDDAAIRGLHGVSVLSVNPYATAGTFETLGFSYEAEREGRVRYRASGSIGAVVDVLDRDASFGREGPGTIHHVAVRVPEEEALAEWRDLFDDRGYDVSRVKDRHFFHSLYVREPGGILFELATEANDVVATVRGTDELGDDARSDSRPTTSKLYLPDRFERDRALIESQLPTLSVPADATGAPVDHADEP